MRLPTGTVTFLFTDIEGSTRLLEELGAEEYRAALAEHRRVLRAAFERHNGVEVDMQGDSFCVAFSSAEHALAAAGDVQALRELPIRVRIGVHTGEPIVAEEGYVGMDVHRAARIMNAGHGGQTVISETTRNLVDGDDLALRDLGSHLLKDLSAPQHLYQLGDGEFPPLRSLHRTNVPVPTTPLIGRKEELAEVAAVLVADDVCLLTLTGPGGTGKTRLALELARRLSADFHDGVFFVELAAISDPILLVPTIGAALELPGENEQVLAESLRDRELLLVLDNLEQLPGASPRLAELLAGCPGLSLLVTSRSPLHLSAERVYALEPLPAPDAFALLAARAQAANPGFKPTGENRAVIEGICRRLDGLPLALELAAARLRLLSPDALLLRLERSLELLVGGARDLPERQQALRSTIAWSDGLLPEPERRFFHRLAVFRSGCTLEAAEAVCNPGGELGETLHLAESLLDSSLVHAQAAVDGESRLHVLQTIREYAAEALAADGEEQLARDRHGGYYLSLAELAEPHLSGSEQASWIARIDQEQDNFREALAHAVETGQTDRELRIVGSLGFFWSVRGRHLAEGRRHLDEALARAGGAPAELRAKALRQNAWIAIRQGQLDDALPLAEEAVEIYRSLGDVGGTHNALGALAVVLIETGEPGKARPVLEESLTLARTLGNSSFVGGTLNNLATLALVEQDYERARELATEALEHFSGLGHSYGQAIALYNIGAAQARQRDFDRALPTLRESLRLSVDLGDDEGVIYCLEAISLLIAEGGDPSLAAELLGCAEARGEEIGVERAQFEQLMHEDALNAVRDRLAEEELTRCRAAGRGTSGDEVVATILQLGSAWPPVEASVD